MSETPDARAARLRTQAEAGPRLSEAAFRTRSRRSFLTGGAAALAGVLGWRWVLGMETDGRIPRLLRSSHEFNEAMWQSLYRPGALAPTFAVARSAMPRVNGMYGLRSPLDADAWRLHVRGPDGQLVDTLDLDAIRRLPRVGLTTELKCIEGWSQIVHWTGTRFSDVAARYDRALTDLPYVGLATPDGGYTVGMDRASMMHPQTLLGYGMQGETLTAAHGAPLRLVTPLKYGVKHLKRIGTIQFMAARPTDFWAERGYDWYLGH